MALGGGGRNVVRNWLSRKEEAAQSELQSSAPTQNQDEADTDTLDGLTTGISKWEGKHMDNGELGCVEAVTKIGAEYSPFLAQELADGVVSVPTLMQNAGDLVIPFSPDQVERGDIIVYDGDEHVVIADGEGGYVGNSTKWQTVLHETNYMEMDGMMPTSIIKTGSGVRTSRGNLSGRPTVAPVLPDFSGLVADEATIEETQEAIQNLIDTDTMTPEQYAAILQAAEMARDTPVGDGTDTAAEAENVNAWQQLLDRKDAKGIFEKDPKGIVQHLRRLGKEQREQRTRAAIENQQQIEATKQALAALRQSVQSAQAQSAAIDSNVQQVISSQTAQPMNTVQVSPNVQMNVPLQPTSDIQIPQNVQGVDMQAMQNAPVQNTFDAPVQQNNITPIPQNGIGILSPQAGNQGVVAHAPSEDLASGIVQGAAAAQQIEQLPVSQEERAGLLSKVQQLEQPLLSIPEYVAARNRQDWDTASRIAYAAGIPGLVQFYDTLMEHDHRNTAHVTPYAPQQETPHTAASEKAPAPVVGVRPLVPTMLPDDLKERQKLSHALGRFMAANKIFVSNQLRDDLSIGRGKAIVAADKKITAWEEKRSAQEAQAAQSGAINTAQTAQEGAQGTQNTVQDRMLAQHSAEPQNGSQTVREKSAQNQGNKKAADEGGVSEGASVSTEPESLNEPSASPSIHAPSSTSTISSKAEESKENSLSDNEREAVKGLSADAKNVYQLVRDKLAGMKNKKVARAASVGAVLLARHADIIARKVRATLGTPFTAMDYYRTWFDLRYGDAEKPYGGFTQKEVETQKETVRKQYTGTAHWMKAPNGEPTNLTEDQWLAVRTPAFKAWFGDWEIANALEFALHGKPVTSLTGREFQSDGVKLTDKVPQWYQANFGGVANHPELGAVKLDLEGVKDSMGHGMGREKAAAYAAVPYIIEHGVVYDRQTNWKQRGYDTSVIVAPIKFAGQDYIGEVVVKRLPNRQGFYLHEVEIQKKLESAFKTPTKGGAPQASKLIIVEHLDKVKNCSKIIDENGEPLVVYHGSDADFNVFDRTKSRANMDIQGMFFSPWELDSKGYGANVRAFFLNIRKPANEGQGYKALNRHQGQNGAGVKAREDLIAAGFDGVNNSDEEFIAFESNQIKSVDNNGAFSPDDVNIFNQSAWHGSPHDFDGFDLGAIGTGEGGQAHGWGLYFAQERSTSEGYRKRLATKSVTIHLGEKSYVREVNSYNFKEIAGGKFVEASSPLEFALSALALEEGNVPAAIKRFEPAIKNDNGNGRKIAEEAVRILRENKSSCERALTGSLFEVGIPNDDVLLDEQKPFDEQPKFVQEKLEELFSRADTYTLLSRLGKTDARFDDLSVDYDDLLSKEYTLSRSDEVYEWQKEEAEELRRTYEKKLADILDGAKLPQVYLRRFKSGREIYQSISDVFIGHSDSKAASLALNKVGIKGITYDGRRDGRCFVIFDDKAIQIIEKFNQQMNEIIKGTTQDVHDGQRIVSLFEEADESTFLHEMGHLFLLDLERLADMSPTSAQELQTVRKWATWSKGQTEEYKGTPFAAEFAKLDADIRAALKKGDEKTANKLKRQWEHERFARGFEMYIKHGEAPTKGLRVVFAKFRAFLQRVYQAFTGMGGRATAEVEAVMARMISIEDSSDLSGYPQGKKTAVYTDSGKKIPVQYRVVSADDLIASHDAGALEINPGYPAALQPRDRERVMMRQQVTHMSNTLRPEDLADGRNLNQGAPLIRNDGVVLNGNGRTIAIQRAQARNKERATAYRDYLVENAATFGLSKEEVESVKNPVLVREVQGDISDVLMQDIIGSTTGGARMGASEAAQADAEKITYAMLDAYVPNDKGDLTTAANRNFVAGILHKVVGNGEMNAYLDKDGHVNADGIQRVKRALFACAYGDDELVAKMSESTDDDIRNVSNGMMSAAPMMARLSVKKGVPYVKELQDAIGAAVKQLDALRASGESVKDYLGAQALFAEHEDSAEMRAILSFLDENKRSGKRIATFFSRVATTLDKMETPSGNELFDAEMPSLMDVLDGARKYAENGGQEGLFGDNAQEVTEIKTALVNLARAAWSDKKAQGKVSFKPSQKLRDKVQELFGHDIDEVFITADDMRHIKNDHSEHEEKRGQVNITPENISDVYEVVNSFDEAEIQKSDPSGNQKMLVVRNGDGKEFALLIERGKHKAQVKTYYAIKKKQSAPMSDAHSPERNVQNDSADTVSSTSNIPRTEAEGKQEPTIEEFFQIVPALKKAALEYGAKDERGKVTFTDETRRQEFLKIAKALLSAGERKPSARRQEALKEMLNGIRLIPPTRVSPRKRVLVDWGREMGVPVVFFKGDPSLHGFHQNGVTFLNVDSEITPQWTFWHEAMHWMKANNPDIYSDLVREIRGAEGFTKKQLDAYRKEIGAPNMSDADVIEEMIADTLPDARRRVPLLQDIGKRDTGLIQRVVAWIHDVMRRFHDHFYAPKGGLTSLQRQAMVRAFGNLARSIRDAEGKPIFRVGYEGARIILHDKSPLPEVKYSLDNGGREGDNESRISDAVFGKYLNDGIMKMVRDKVSAEIAEHVDLAAMSDPVARDAARDRLPYIRKMLADYNTNTIQNKPAYRDRLAVKIEYARRCFDNDPRVQHGAIRQVDGYERPQDLHRTGQAAVPGRNDGRGMGEAGRQGTRGVSRSISGERAGARAHFDKLYEDMRKHLEQQGAFSMPKFSANTQEDHKGNFKWLTGAIRRFVGVAPADNLELPGRPIREQVLSSKELEQRIKERWIQEKNITSQEKQPDGKVKVTYYPDTHDVGYADWIKSVRQVAKRNPFVQALYKRAHAAMKKQERLRNEFGKALKTFADLVKNPEDLKTVATILWLGDAKGKVYTDAELRSMGASENAIKAYKLVREVLERAYKMLNDARMQVQTRSQTMTAESVETFKKNHWIKDEDVISVQPHRGGQVLLTWRGGKTYDTKDKVITAEALELLKKDDDIIVTRATPLSPTQYGEGMYEVDYVERIRPIHRLTGYMPHFFHEWMVYEKYQDPNTGQIRYTTIGSGRTMNEAVKIGNEIAAKNKDKQYVLRPKGFDLGVENSVVIGDMDFAQMTKKLAESTEMTLTDARTFLQEDVGVSLKSRHRFFGSLLERKDGKGFDQDVQWVLAHYLNGAARYIAMEEFKPWAISMYERFFGAFDAEPKNLTAKYCKDLINDVNGNPRGVEVWLNDLIKKTWLGKHVADSFGDRVALAINGELSTWNAITKLGLLNFASAAVNFSQFINVGAALNDYGYAAKGLKRALNPSALDESTRGQKVRMFVPYVLFCGMCGSLPFGGLFNQLFSFLFGLATGDDEDIAQEVKAEVLRWAGKDPVKKAIAETALYGILAPTFGLDISGRIGMSNAFAGEFYGEKPDSISGIVGQQLGGPMAVSAISPAQSRKRFRTTSMTRPTRTAARSMPSALPRSR